MTSERIQRRVERLLDQAEEAADRKEWMASADAAREALALDATNHDGQALLSAAEKMLRFPQDSADDRSKPEPAAQPTSFTNGRYRVLKFLGEGGKKKVYLAHDALLDRDVAFALIKTEGLDEAGKQRITREAQAMGRLGDHPNIVSVYDLGEEEGQPYMVLPLLPGGDVEGLIEKAPEHRLPLERLLQIGIEVCQGLEFAHSKGIVHRDLKPGNVWLADPSTSSGQAVAKIGDFGLAVAIDRSRLTQAGMMVGTVSYMPPEQAMGGEVTARSDLYSLGCMLYEMVCGRPPFVGESVAIIGQHLNTPPVAPTWHRPDCPAGLEALVLRLLEKDASKRPASAAEVRQALSSLTLALSLEGRGDQKSSEPSPSPGRGQGEGPDPLYQRTFVGREQELKALESAFDAALSGQGSLAMVVGEPGIGKTALCEQLATYVAMRGGKALVGHCYEEGSLSLPYLAFVEAMRSYVLAREPDGLKSDLGTGAADVARIISEVRDRVSGVELRAAGDPEDDRWRLLQAVSSFLRNASTAQPLLIVLEDLHWADRGTLDLLLHVARNLSGARLMLVGTYRDVEVDRSHPLSGVIADLRRIEGFQRVPLRGLTIDEVQRMMTNIRGQVVSGARAEAVHRQTEGNPLFVQEVLRYLVEEGLVVRQDGRYVPTYDTADPTAGIPEGLRDVIGKRLSRLSPECNRLLAVAAVIGRDFDLETLRSVSGVDEDALLSAIEEAVRVGVLEERSQPGRVLYRFAHAFFRQTLYEEMIAPRRLRLHQEVARALEAQYGTRRDDHAAELAEHYAQSTDRADLAKAVEYGELAAQRAMSVYAYAEAASHLERCLAVQEVLDPDDKAKRCDLLLELGEALMPAGEPLRVAEQVAEEAFSFSKAIDDRQKSLTACILALEALNRYGAATVARTPGYQRWLERADDYAERPSSNRIIVDCLLGNRALTFRNATTATLMYDRALSDAREIGNPDSLFRAAWSAMGTTPHPPNDEERIRLAEEFCSRPREGVRVPNLGWLFYRGGIAFMDWGDRQRAEAVWSELDALAARTRDPDSLLRPLVIKCIISTIDGRLDAVVETAEKLVTLGDSLGAPVLGQQFASGFSSRALIHLGLAEKAISAELARLEALQLQESDIFLARRALAEAHLGNLDGAEASLRELMGTNPDAAIREMNPVLPISLLETAVLAQHLQYCEALTSFLAPSSHLVSAFHLTGIARHLGAAAALLGKLDEARAYYNQALEVCIKIRFRPEIALTRLELAELLLEHYPDERATAIEHLDFAIGEFTVMKMQPSLERALRHRGLLKA